MCLAIPGSVVEVFEKEGLRFGRVAFGGVRREVCLHCTPEAEVGDYVLVHVGFALSVIDEAEARRSYALLAELDALSELGEPDPGGSG